ncbi:efflux RND transporter periplasmic adaptor subunit [Aquibaculum sediminis]|uniref:efflux RND transporter periplasmic adaptor subunit n=1 Tax=Aquibaculum sediminis TaxID=3231907 RepID=UPI00345305DB
MRLPTKQAGKAFAVLLGLALGGALLILFVANRQAPERLEAEARPVAVSVIEARPLTFRLEARGHGVARPTETWQAVANVAGRVVERHPDLESGAFLRTGTLLVVLDPSRYELTIAEIEGEIASLKAESLQLDTEEDNAQRLLEVEREQLALSERELARVESLADRGTVAPARRDEQRRATLTQRQAVVSLENTLALLPSRRAMLDAQRARATTRLAQARRDLDDTRFVAPYDLRLGEVEVELHQFVGVGQRLFQADSLAAAEVEARVPFSMLRRLLGSVAPGQPPQGALGLGERIDFSAIEAELELVGAPGVRWSGRVVRVASGLDPETRTVRVVVRVDHPYRDALPPDRPPLQRDMYTRVRLSAASPDPLMAIPASAVHQDEIYLVDEADRLERRHVEVAFEQGGLAVITSGLTAGERVVVDDLPSALRGMALAPRRDEALERRITAQAAGTRP